MVQRTSRTDRLFGRDPSVVPEWMAIRDADRRRRIDHQAKLRDARLARDANQSATAASALPAPGKRSRKKRASP
jgi:hypothetical protein